MLQSKSVSDAQRIVDLEKLIRIKDKYLEARALQDDVKTHVASEMMSKELANKAAKTITELRNTIDRLLS